MPTTIDRSRLQELLQDHAQLVEVLPRRKYEAEHLPGAIIIPLRDTRTHLVNCGGDES
jgi:rhodanese-related sulfurtransferase